jgi:hypothetical protein
VSANKGLLKPCPSTIERAILPVSYPKCQWSRCGSSCSGSKKIMTPSRIANATKTMDTRKDGKRSSVTAEVVLGLEDGGKAKLFSTALDHKAWIGC